MNKKRIVSISKNFLITGLVVLCIFQVSALWFGDAGIFELLRGAFVGRTTESTMDDALEKLTTPFRIILNTSNDRYNVIYSDIADSPQRIVGNNAIYAAFSGGTARVQSYNPMLPARIIYEYAVPMPAEVFDKRFRHTISNRINVVDAIYFVVDSSEITIVFADRIAEITLHYSFRNNTMYNELMATVSGTGSLYYVRENGVFIPQWGGGWHMFNTVSVASSFPGQTLASVGRYVTPFFDRPSAVTSQMTSGMFIDEEITLYMYSADRVIVRYYIAARVLEYSNHNFIPNETLQSFTQSFAAALNVINRDETLQNEFFLADYTRNAYGFTFYFDAVVNNFPVTISNDLARTTDMRNFIEVTVSNNRVLYRRYAVEFLVLEQTMQATIRFDGFERNMLNYTGQTVNRENQNNLRFGYMVTDEQYMVLHWSIGFFDTRASR